MAYWFKFIYKPSYDIDERHRYSNQKAGNIQQLKSNCGTIMIPSTDDSASNDGRTNEEELGLLLTTNNNNSQDHTTTKTTTPPKQKTEGTTAGLTKYALFISAALNLLLFLNGVFEVDGPPGQFVEDHRESQEKELEAPDHDEKEQHGWIRPDKVYGLVHMAKTAGTEINGELAARYEHVCGNKGYSYDFFATNQRTKEMSLKRNRTSTHFNLGESVSKLYPGNNRGNPAWNFSIEIGFEDCDYIALEMPGGRWVKFTEKWPMEMHVPCRDPLSHLMSQCNMGRKVFHCNATDLKAEIGNCLMNQNRFNPNLGRKNNTVVKCFDPLPPSRYVEFMGSILEHKRIKSDYFHRATNKPRDKEQECIWKAGKEFQDQVAKIMKDNWSYYHFCDECRGSKDDLFS